MKKKFLTTILVTLTILITSCSAATPVKSHTKDQWITARITYYTPASPDGKRVACPKVKTAKEGITVAAHPKLPFGTRIEIPELKGVVGNGSTFIVQDRGTAVTRKKASHGKADVIDVFVNSERKLRAITKTKPKYMKVHIVSIK
jgi:3D (Asp-Asp-Asp) domain-containing protein